MMNLQSKTMVRFSLVIGLFYLASCSVLEKRTSAGRARQPDVVGAGSDAAPIEKRSLSAMFEGQLAPGVAFTSRDATALSQLRARPPTHALGRAVTTLLTVRKVQTKQQEGRAAAKSAESLEAEMRQSRIDLHSELANNPFLKNVAVFNLIESVLNSSQDQPGFKVRFQKLLNDQVTAWNQLAQGDPVAATNAAALAASPEPNAPTALPVEDNNVVPGGAQAPASRIDDSRRKQILAEADDMAAAGRFEDAITRMKPLQGDAPSDIVYKQRIKHYSESAVHALRQKAAKSFADAAPVNDPASKRLLLEQAISHLDRALQNFPDAPASQRETLEMNRKVISKQMESIR